MENYIKTFDNVCNFVKFIENNPLNKTFENRQSSERIDETGCFFDTVDYNQAQKEIIEGRKIELEQLTKEVNNLTTGFLKTEKRYQKAPMGGVVNVMAFNSGSAFCRRRKVSKKVKSNIIIINYCANIYKGIKSNDVCFNSAKLLSAINILTAKGYAIELNLLDISKSDKKALQYIGCKICLKKDKEKINLRNLSYTLCSSSMARRHFFKFLENAPTIISKKFENTHGLAILDKFEIAKLFQIEKDSIILYTDLEKETTTNLIKKLSNF